MEEGAEEEWVAVENEEEAAELLSSGAAVKVDKAGDGVFVDAKLVQQTPSKAATWNIEYAEDGEAESGIPLSRLQKKKEPAELRITL